MSLSSADVGYAEPPTFMPEGILEQMAANHFKRVLTGPIANAVPVACEVQLFHLSIFAACQCDVDKADWLIGVGTRFSRARSRDAGDRDAERSSGAGADAFSKRAGYLR